LARFIYSILRTGAASVNHDLTMKHFGAEAAAATGTTWTDLVSETFSIEVYLELVAEGMIY
jgi:hypothetical protein